MVLLGDFIFGWGMQMDLSEGNATCNWIDSGFYVGAGYLVADILSN